MPRISRRGWRRRARLAAAVFAFPAVALPSPAAADHDWIANSGNWNTPGNWSPTGVPAAGDAVYIINTNQLLDQINYDYTGAAISIGSLEVSNTGGGADVLNMTTTGQSLSSQYETLGGFFFGDPDIAGSGTINQSTGTNSVNTLDIGFFAKDYGAYNLSSTATLSLANSSPGLIVGLFGTGAFTQSGGLSIVSGSGSGSGLYLAYEAGAVGTYMMTGGFLTLAAQPQGTGEYIGYGGNGSFNQSGGGNRLVNNEFIYLGYNAGATGSYTLSGSGIVYADGVENIGYSGVGIFNQSGGTNSVEADQGIFGFYLGRNTGSTGTYILSGGSLGVSMSGSGSEFIGNSGAGVFNQTGGTHTLDHGASMFLAFNTGATGSYALGGGSLNFSGGANQLAIAAGANTTASFTQSGGSLTFSSGSQGSGEYVGSSGYGSFNQSGGVNRLNNNFFIYVGYNAGATGTYTLSGTGLILADGVENIGYDGVGVFNQSGGTNSLEADQGIFGFYLGRDAGSSGTYILSGGSLGISMSGSGSEFIGNSGAGVFNQTGGTHTLDHGASMFLAENAGATAKYFFNGGSLTFSGGSNQLAVAAGVNTTATFVLSGTATLNFASTGQFGGMFVGQNGNGIFNQSGGLNSITGTGGLVVGENAGATGTYNLSSTGSLVSSLIETVGSSGVGIFNQTGGVNTITNGEYLQLGLQSGSKGIYAISGGTFTADSIAVGTSLNSVGQLIISGTGVVNTGSGLYAFIGGPGNGITLTGGTINTSGLITDGVPSQFHWVSGTLHFTGGASFDSSASAFSPADGFGAGLSMSANQNLYVSGSEVLGGGGPFALTLNSGALNSVDGVLITLNNGTLNVANGTVAVTGSLSTFGPTALGGSVMTTAGQYYNAPVSLSGAGATVSDPIGPINFYDPINGASQALTLIAPSGTSFRGTSTLGSLLVQSGNVTLVGAVTLSASNEYIGINGSGAFAQSTGVNVLPTFGNSLYIGYNAGDTGSYTLSGSGSLSVASNEFVGFSGVGLFNQSGGVHTVGSGLSIGLGGGAVGTYILSAGSLFTGSQLLAGGIVGPGTANFIQTGGFNSASSLSMAFLSHSTAAYSLSNTGILTSIGEVIATSGVAQFTQSGGLHQINGDLDLATAPGSTGSYLLSNTGSLSAQNVYVGGSSSVAGGRGVMTITNSATLSLTSLLKVWNNGRVNLDVPSTSIGNLSIAGNGIVNLNGALQINYGSPANDPVVAVVSYLQSGYNGGAWTGTSGIISTSIPNASSTLSLGYTDGKTDTGTAAGPNQIVIKYTLAGDANLDGLVNFNDLVAVVQNFNKSGTDWARGNFTYATSTNFNDLVEVVQNFNKTLPPPSGSGAELAGTTLPLADGAAIKSTDVQLPEPASFALLAGAALLKRRRRR